MKNWTKSSNPFFKANAHVREQRAGSRNDEIMTVGGITMHSGKRMTPSTVCVTEHGFESLSTGKERDTESGLDYFGARYYGSNMGRFMSPDDDGGHLEDPQTLNKYAYVGNNPLSRTDPDGHDFWQSCDKASATCGSQQIGTNKGGSAINHLVQGTTTNGQFSATVIASASLGAAGSGNSATVNGTGVEITSSRLRGGEQLLNRRHRQKQPIRL
jgi:RHS repeat-associated protein